MTFTRLVDEGFSGDQWSPLRGVVTFFHSTDLVPAGRETRPLRLRSGFVSVHVFEKCKYRVIPRSLRRGNLLVKCNDNRNPKATVQTHTIHPPHGKSNLPPGDSHVAARIRNDMILRFRWVVTVVRSLQGRVKTLPYSPFLNCQLSIVNSENPGDCHTSVRTGSQ